MLVEFDEIDAMQCLLAHPGLEHQTKESGPTGGGVDEEVGVPELVTRCLYGTKGSRDRLLADHRIVGRRIAHHDVW
ncbi:MAG: hypothetical protein ACR2MK_03400, partial [Solirubrobacteraceae bacterium]